MCECDSNGFVFTRNDQRFGGGRAAVFTLFPPLPTLPDFLLCARTRYFPAVVVVVVSVCVCVCPPVCVVVAVRSPADTFGGD